MQRWPWYVPVFGAYPLLYIAASNPGQVQSGEVATVVAAGLLIAVALVVLIRPLVGNWNAAGLSAACLVLLFYLYGPVNEWWLNFLRESFEQRAAGQHWYNTNPQLVHSVAWVLLAIGGIARIRRAGPSVNPAVTGGLNLVAVLLAAFVAAQGIANHLRHRGPDTREVSDSRLEATPGSVSAGPDIYFIVLDGYARADILDVYYGFDNSPFLDGLRARGFQVSDASRSNFYWTFLSVGSSLNLDYVQSLLGDALDPASRDRSQLYRLLRDNRAARFLRERGYRFVQLQSTWGGTSSNAYADEFLPCQTGIFGNEYLRAVADSSWLRALESKASLDVANCHLRNFETLGAEASAPGPKFVFAHFMPPHHPYLFDRDGNILRKATISDQFEFQKRLWEDRKSYVEQLRYVNRRIAGVVDRLLKDSPQPPVILLVSDHGPNLRQGMHPQEERHVRLANLTAMYLPGAPADFLPADATPVNHMRRVLNRYFDANLPILQDRYFISSYQRPLDLQEVGLDNRPLLNPPGF